MCSFCSSVTFRNFGSTFSIASFNIFHFGFIFCTTFRFNPEAFQGVLVKENDLENTTYRFTLEDGTWGLVRASSNKPSLVVVCESPVSNESMHAMFKEIDTRLSKYPEVGEYDQKI